MTILVFAIRMTASTILFTAFGVTWLNFALIAIAALLYTGAMYLEMKTA